MTLRDARSSPTGASGQALHADALATLRAWLPPTPAQGELRQAFVEHLVQHGDGMWRSSYPGHVTAGTLVLSHDGDRVLLNLHGKAQRWFHFGGHCEEDDATLAAVALREAVEESGVGELDFHPEPMQLDVHLVPFCGDRGEVSHLDVRYVAFAPTDAVAAASDESLDVRWWPLDGLPELEPAMHELIGRARSLL